MGIKDFIYSVYLNLWHFANIIIILTWLISPATGTNSPLITDFFSIISTIPGFIHHGSHYNPGCSPCFQLYLPLFEIARSASYTGFIRNTEPIFVSIFMLDSYVSVVSFCL